VLHQGGGEKAGIAKTPEITSHYVYCFTDILRGGHLALEEDWFTHTPINGSKKNLWQEAKEQISRYGRDEKGKLTGKFGSFQDDIAIALMMLPYWSRAVERNDHRNPYNNLKS